MAKKSPKKRSSKVLINTKKVNVVQLGVLIFGLVMLGILITRLFAAASNTAKVPQRVGQLSLRYDEESAYVVDKADDGTVFYPSVGFSVDVATDGTVYCLPTNATVGTKRALTRDEVRSLRRSVSNQRVVEESKSQVVPTTIINNGPTLTIGSESGDQVERIQAYDLEKAPRFKEAARIMKSLCDNPTGEPIARPSKPVFVPTLVNTATPTPLSFQPLEYIRSAIIPTAHAATVQQQMADLQLISINNARKGAGLAALTPYPCLTLLAADWSFQMASTGDFKHNPYIPVQDLTGGTNGTCNNYWAKWGENVVIASTVNMGVPEANDQLFFRFMASEHHRDNILDPNFTHIGVGAYANDIGVIYVTHEFMKCKIGSNRVSLCAAGKKK